MGKLLSILVFAVSLLALLPDTNYRSQTAAAAAPAVPFEVSGGELLPTEEDDNTAVASSVPVDVSVPSAPAGTSLSEEDRTQQIAQLLTQLKALQALLAQLQAAQH